MGWALTYDKDKGYFDLQINEKNKTFITTDDVGDETGIIEMLKYTLGTHDDNNDNNNDPNFTLSAPVFDYYTKDDPRGTRLESIINNRTTGQDYLNTIKAECERATQPLLKKEFKNNKICDAILFTPKQEGETVILDIQILFNDNTFINTTQIFNNT